MVKVRFAPSPTGYIHIGNTRTALFNWLFAKKHDGTFVLRYDDTDIERSKQEYVQAIAEDLAWLGIKPDEIYYQSKRFSRYDEVVEDLKRQGVLYPCFETQQELELSRKVLLTRGLPPVYNRKALSLTEAEKEELIKQGRKPHWRFLLPNYVDSPFKTTRTNISWQDVVKGEQTIDLASLSDPILIREDGTYLYTLPSVIDDIDMEITHIIRGEDHVTNSAMQIAIFEAIGAKPPVFAHTNLLTTTSGEGLSKRTGSLSIRSLREDGFEPMSIVCLGSLIGTSENVIAYRSMDELGKRFNLTNTSKSAAKFSTDDLIRLNKSLINNMPFAEAKERLEKIGIVGNKAEVFWEQIKGNISKIDEASMWWDVVNNNEKVFYDLVKDNKEFLAEAANLLPLETFDDTTFKRWTNSIKQSTGRSGKNLFSPLRLAITGQANGPDLSQFLPLIDPEIVRNRILLP